MSDFNVILPNSECPNYRKKLSKYMLEDLRFKEGKAKKPYCLLYINESGECRNKECPYNKTVNKEITVGDYLG